MVLKRDSSRDQRGTCEPWHLRVLSRAHRSCTGIKKGVIVPVSIMATDRISNLSDDVLGKILSLVPTKVAASTSVLSKRWRNSLLPLVDNLDFDEWMLFYPDRKEEATSRRFSDFVDNTLAQLSTCPLIKKFSLNFDYEDDESRFNRWTHFALERGCLELNLKKSGGPIRIDTDFFTSKSLVTLTLSGELHPFGLLPCGGVFFPALKTLSLVSVPFPSPEIIQSFIHGCPALEELFVYEWMSYLSSPCVKRLTITGDFDYAFEIGGIVLETPSLLYLDYSDYTVGNYNVSLDSLVEARLDLRLHDDPFQSFDDEIDITSLIEGMSNIKSLQLTPDSLEVFYFCCHSMPVLNNLLSLSIEIHKGEGWKVIPRLLDSSPNLQTLVIKGLVHARIPTKNKEMACSLSRCRVKVLEISEYKGSRQELKQLRLFIGKLECLETVKVGNNLLANLMALPRVSSKCKFQFI